MRIGIIVQNNMPRCLMTSNYISRMKGTGRPKRVMERVPRGKSQLDNIMYVKIGKLRRAEGLAVCYPLGLSVPNGWAARY